MKDTPIYDQLGEKDIAILQAVRDGHDDTIKIREATTLDNRTINHQLVEKKNNLEELGVVKIDRPNGPERREVDGRIQYLPHAPKRVALTQEGKDVLKEAEGLKKYKRLTKAELIRKVRKNEERIDKLETRLDVIVRQAREIQRD